MNKFIPKATLYIFKALHYAFLLAILKEDLSTTSILVFCIIALLLIFFSYTKISANNSSIHWKDVTIPIFISFGAVGTYYLNDISNFGIVLSACTIGIIGIILSKLKFSIEADAAVYCGTFIGMTSIFIAEGYMFLIGSSVLASLIYISSRGFLNGFGGKLGTTAFGGVCSMAVIIHFL